MRIMPRSIENDREKAGAIMKKINMMLMVLFALLLSGSVIRAQDTDPEISAVSDAETASESADPEEEEEEEDPRIKLNISYQKDEDEEPFLIGKYLHMPGFFFNIASPVIEGYLPDTQRLTGVLTQDLEWTVYYHLQTYSLTVHYRLLDGRTAAPDYQLQMTFGDEYRIVPPYVAGYKAVRQEITGEMPGRDVEQTVFFVPANATIR